MRRSRVIQLTETAAIYVNHQDKALFGDSGRLGSIGHLKEPHNADDGAAAGREHAGHEENVVCAI